MTLVDSFLIHRLILLFPIIHKPQDSDALLSLQLDSPILQNT